MLYLFESAVCLAAFYLLYHLLLRGETFFQANRCYLVAVMLLSFVLPAVHFDWAEKTEVPDTTNITWVSAVETLQLPEQQMAIFLEKPPVAAWSISLSDLLWGLWSVVAFCLFIRFVWRLIALYFLLKKSKKTATTKGVTLVDTKGKLPLASFFSFVFIEKNSLNQDQTADFKIAHELIHARHWHSLDVLLMELVCILLWFNPLVYAYRKSLREVHEFIADAAVVAQTKTPYAYAKMLLDSHQSPCPKEPIISTFHSHLKQRLIMLTKRPSHPLRMLRYTAVLPIFALALAAFSFRFIEKIEILAKAESAVEQFEAQTQNMEITLPTAETKPDVNSLPEIEESNYITPQNQAETLIFYWGSFQSKATSTQGKIVYFEPITINTADFRASILREPRLFNGKTIEPTLTFSMNGLAIKSRTTDKTAFAQNIVAVNEVGIHIKGGEVLYLTEISLPDGQVGALDIWIKNPEAPTGEQPAAEKRVWSYEEEGYTELWGEALFHKKTTRDFYGKYEILPLFDLWKTYVQENPSSNDDKLSLVLIPRNEDPIEITLSNNAERWVEVEKDLKAHLAALVPGSRVIFQYKSQADLLEHRLSFLIVPEDHFSIDLRKKDQKNIRFEWGTFTYNNRIYGKVLQPMGKKAIALDNVSLQNIEMEKSELKQMFQMTPMLYLEGEANPIDRMVMRIGEMSFSLEKTGSGFRPDMLDVLESAIDKGESIEITEIHSDDGFDILTWFFTFTPKADKPTAPFKH